MMQTKRFFKQFGLLGVLPQRNFRAAVILSGCGVYDGSEITESVSLLIALSKNGASYQVFAPNIDQAHVVNHTDGSEMPVKRNVLQESARIARGNVKDLATLNASDFDAVLLPGGFGAAKNLSDFAFKGDGMTVNDQVEKALKAFHSEKKVIGLACIAPVVAARVFGTKFGGPGVTLTLGSKGDKWPYNGSIDVAEGFGNTLVEKQLSEVCIDEAHKVYSTPAYMRDDAKPHEIYEGIEAMVKAIARSFKK